MQTAPRKLPHAAQLLNLFLKKKKIRRKISIQFWTAVKMVYRPVWKCIIFDIKFWSFLSVDNWYTDMTKHIKLKMFECVPRVNGISTKKETCGQWIKFQQYAFGLLSIIYLNLFSNNEKKSNQKKKIWRISVERTAFDVPFITKSTAAVATIQFLNQSCVSISFSHVLVACVYHTHTKMYKTIEDATSIIMYYRSYWILFTDNVIFANR